MMKMMKTKRSFVLFVLLVILPRRTSAHAERGRLLFHMLSPNFLIPSSPTLSHLDNRFVAYATKKAEITLNQK